MPCFPCGGVDQPNVLSAVGLSSAAFMFIATLIAAFWVGRVPDNFEKLAILLFPLVIFAAAMLTSRRAFDAIQNVFGPERLPAPERSATYEPPTEIHPAGTTNLLTVPAGVDANDLGMMPSVAGETTRQLEQN